MKKVLGPQVGSEIRVLAIFSRLHQYFPLILHKIAAWDNVEHLGELKPPQIGAVMIFSILMSPSVHSNLLVNFNLAIAPLRRRTSHNALSKGFN